MKKSTINQLNTILIIILFFLSTLIFGCQSNRLICEEKTDWRLYHYTLEKCGYEHSVFKDSTNINCKEYAKQESTIYQWYRCSYLFGKEVYRKKIKTTNERE